jgi:glutamate synthase domain-containing protein 2
MKWRYAILGGTAAAAAATTVHDLVQTKHAIVRNFPVIGHARFFLERFGPELRQYIVTSNEEERPFSRDQRRWIYASSKKENNSFGFGTDNELELSPNYLIIKHATFPHAHPSRDDDAFDAHHGLPSAKTLGEARGRAKAFRPRSVVNSSAMSFGSLSGPAVEAINRGAKLAGCLQNTGEGGITPHHLCGGDLIWQIGTGYFGCREPGGGFSMPRFLDQVAAHPVRMIEIKLSQGAKPGKGGILPAAKVTAEIAAIRGIPEGVTCHSPASHSAFRDADEMLDFVERLADATGLPVGIKSAVGELHFWEDLARLMEPCKRGVDFITIDGGEGGTGAAPLVFTDHVALPFKVGFTRVYRLFAERALTDRITFVGSGKLGLPEQGLLAMALGCDMLAVAREAMLAVGCIQAQRCHTGHCPTGVATQNRWLTRGLDPRLKAVRFANYVSALRKDLLALANACGRAHPALVEADAFEILDGRFGTTNARELFRYEPGWGLPSPADRAAIERWIDAAASTEAGSTEAEQQATTTAPVAGSMNVPGDPR